MTMNDIWKRWSIRLENPKNIFQYVNIIFTNYNKKLMNFGVSCLFFIFFNRIKYVSIKKTYKIYIITQYLLANDLLPSSHEDALLSSTSICVVPIDFATVSSL